MTLFFARKEKGQESRALFMLLSSILESKEALIPFLVSPPTVCGVNWGCKDLPVLLNGTKNYVVVGQLGIATDTYNETGRVTDEQPYGTSGDCQDSQIC
jgi:hypothetical protein